MDIVLVSERGKVKKMTADQLRRQSRGGVGVTALGLAEGDRLAAVVAATENQDIVLLTQKGMAIRFASSEARAMGRTAAGVAGMNVREGDKVVAALAL